VNPWKQGSKVKKTGAPSKKGKIAKDDEEDEERDENDP
jgi:hypothetical protein